MKLEEKLEEIINEVVELDNDLKKDVKWIDNENFLMKLFYEEISYTYLLLCKLNNQSIEVVQIVDKEVAEDFYDVVYSFDDEKTLIKFKWSSWEDTDAYDIRAYEYRFENETIVLKEIRYTDLVKKPDMTDRHSIGLTLINAIDNGYFPCSMLDECFKSLCIKWDEKIDWELYKEVLLSLEEDEEIEVENYLDIIQVFKV